MAEYAIPEVNWVYELTSALRKAVPGDTIVVGTQAQASLAETAAKRMSKTGLSIVTLESSS